MAKRPLSLFLLLFLFLSALGQDQRPAFQGTTAVAVDTTSRPIVRQERKSIQFDEDGVTFSNQFDGARLTALERTSANEYSVTVTPENEPVNMSPWYAFRVWSAKKKEIFVTLRYPEFARHRYSPLVSKNGRDWKPLDASRIEEIGRDPNENRIDTRPKAIRMRLKVGRTPIWISAQELQNSATVFGWMDRLARKKKLKVEEIGRSTEGRPIRMLTIGNRDSKKMILVISRQHPPEVTGYFAMQAFVEEILDGSKLSKNFRRDWTVYVVPLMNPDGVDNGQWRHNSGGIDLNRDWASFNQPETRAIRDFLKRRESETGGRFYFGIDFHSTWDDIYYPMDKKFSDTNMPNLVWDWLDAIKKAIPKYEPNIRPNDKLEPTIVSRNYFLKEHRMEAIVFEIGDNTPRKFIREKGETGARELMKLMLGRNGAE